MDDVYIFRLLTCIISLLITANLCNTDKIKENESFLSKIFLLQKFEPESFKYIVSKFLMLLYIFCILTQLMNLFIDVIVGTKINIGVQFFNVLFYPIVFRAFFNGSYEK